MHTIAPLFLSLSYLSIFCSFGFLVYKLIDCCCVCYCITLRNFKKEQVYKH